MQVQSGHAYNHGRPYTADMSSSGQRRQSGPSGSPASSAEETKLKRLIKEIKESVEGAKGFWTKLPYSLCQEDDAASLHSHVTNANSNNNDKDKECWNGREPGRYKNGVVHDGLVNQETNPEVFVDISRPDVDINEQIFALKLMARKLESAYNGQHVEWPVHKGEKIGKTRFLLQILIFIVKID